MKLYVGNVDKSFKSVLLSNAYEYAKCFNGKNRLELISKKSLLDKNNLIIQKYDPNYLFSCLVKENLDREDEKIIGSAVVRQIFKFSKVGNIAGVYVTDGIVKNNANVRVIRDGKILIDTKISSIQRGKDQAKEVKKGFECGITLEKYDDFKEGDTFEVYVMEQVKHA